MACDTDRAVGIQHARLLTRAVVLDDLELEPAGRFVVADDFDEILFFLITEIHAVLEQLAGITLCGERFCGCSDHHTRKSEKLRRGRRTLQGAAERNQHRGVRTSAGHGPRV
jgi:hypothetical protein